MRSPNDSFLNHVEWRESGANSNVPCTLNSDSVHRDHDVIEEAPAAQSKLSQPRPGPCGRGLGQAPDAGVGDCRTTKQLINLELPTATFFLLFWFS